MNWNSQVIQIIKATNLSVEIDSDHLTRNSEKSMTVKLAWWFHSAEYALVKKFGWTEKDAAKFVASYHPTTSIYKATV